MSGSANSRNHRREAHTASWGISPSCVLRALTRRARRAVFSLDIDLSWTSGTRKLSATCGYPRVVAKGSQIASTNSPIRQKTQLSRQIKALLAQGAISVWHYDLYEENPEY